MKLVAPTAYAFRTHQIYTNLKTQSWDSGGSCAHLLLGRRYWPPTQYSASAGRYLRIRRWGGCVYVLQIFFCFFCLFLFFSFATKYQTTVLENSWTDFHETFTKRQRAQRSFQRRTEMGTRPPIYFWGLKTTHCALGGDAWRVTEN